MMLNWKGRQAVRALLLTAQPIESVISPTWCGIYQIFCFYPFSSSINRLRNSDCQTYCGLSAKPKFTVLSKHKLSNSQRRKNGTLVCLSAKKKVQIHVFPLTLVQNILADQWSMLLLCSRHGVSVRDRQRKAKSSIRLNNIKWVPVRVVSSFLFKNFVNEREGEEERDRAVEKI